MKKKSIGSWLLIITVLVFLYIPVVVVVVYSFNNNTSRIPVAFTGWTTEWYHKLFTSRNGFGDALLLSLRVALWSVALSCVIGTMGAIGMSLHQTRFSRALENLVTLPIMIPEIILGFSLMVIYNALDLHGNELRLVLAHTTFCIPYVFLNVKSRLVGMDEALNDAARDLGANRTRVLFDITLPLCRPAVLSGSFLALAMSLDDFVISFFVYGAGEGTLPIKIYSSVKVGISAQVNALCTLMIGTVFVAVAMARYLTAVRKKREAEASLAFRRENENTNQFPGNIQ